MALAAPLSVTNVPLPELAGLIVPEMLHVVDNAVKLTAVAFAPLIVTAWFAGLNVNPDFVGVTVYDPLARFEKL